MKAFALSDLRPELQKQVLALAPKGPNVAPAVIAAPKDRLRQSHAGMNKTEAAFFEHLKAEFAGARRVLPQSITLKLGNGVRYTPDFIVQSQEAVGPTLSAYEVKGHMRDDAAVKLKVAASAYPWIAFFLVTRGKGGTWRIQKIIS